MTTLYIYTSIYTSIPLTTVPVQTAASAVTDTVNAVSRPIVYMYVTAGYLTWPYVGLTQDPFWCILKASKLPPPPIRLMFT